MPVPDKDRCIFGFSERGTPDRNFAIRVDALEGTALPLSLASRRAQSRLANAVRNRASADDVVRLRVEFYVARALDALNAIPSPITKTEQRSLHSAVDVLHQVGSGEGVTRS